MTSLFKENEEYTDRANHISIEIENAVKPIIVKYMAEGYKARELGYLAIHAISFAEAIEVLSSISDRK